MCTPICSTASGSSILLSDNIHYQRYNKRLPECLEEIKIHQASDISLIGLIPNKPVLISDIPNHLSEALFWKFSRAHQTYPFSEIHLSFFGKRRGDVCLPAVFCPLPLPSNYDKTPEIKSSVYLLTLALHCRSWVIGIQCRNVVCPSPILPFLSFITMIAHFLM